MARKSKTEMQQPSPMEFGVNLGPVNSWQAFHKRIAADVTFAYLLEPKNAKRRAGIVHRFLAADKIALKGESAGSPELSASFAEIENQLIGTMGMAAQRGGAQYYKAKLRVDPADDSVKVHGNASKNLLTLGLLMRAMQWAEDSSPGCEVSLDEMKKFFLDQDTTEMVRNLDAKLFKISEAGFKDAKDENRRVAPLAAAYLYFVESEYARAEDKPDSPKKRHFRSHDRRILRNSIGEFLAHAQWFEDLYFTIKNRSDTPKYHIDIHTVSRQFGIQPIEPDPAIGRPAGFEEAFPKWHAERQNRKAARKQK